jgi:hypothetical protein
MIRPATRTIKSPNIGCTCSRTAKSIIPQAADERKVIVPRCEIERRVKGGAERRKRMLSTVENFGGAACKHPAMIGGQARAVILA